ncbi:MAG: prolyl oligopeptidase family serine peptidase [Rubrivivax sp.]
MKTHHPFRLSLGLVAGAFAVASLLPSPGQAQTAPAAANASTPPPELPLRDFFRSPERAYFRISEDGRWLSFMQPAVGDGGPTPRRNIFVQALKDGQPQGAARQLTRESARDISSYNWKGNGTLLFEKDFGGDENFHVVAVDAQTGKVRDLTPWDGVRASIVDPLINEPGHILVSHNHRDRKVFDVVRMDLKTGAQTVVATNPGNVLDWVTDHQGQVRLAVASDGVNNELLVRNPKDGTLKSIIRTDFRTSVNPQFFHADNQRFYAVSNRGRDKSALVLIDPAQPDAEELVFQHPEVDVYQAQFSRQRKVLTEAVFQTDKSGRQTFDAATTKLYAALAKHLPGMELNLQSATRDETRFIVAASNDRTSGTRYFYDARSDRLVKLGVVNPWLPEAQMAPVKPVRYTARDGLSIPGYLTLPVGRTPKNLACVINPHGGPWARDSWGFNPEVQFLANRGFCVLQMNFRGSTGYGRQFWEASFGQWGLKMQDDITDGVKWLVDQGIADPKRIGIYGASYGGYATLAGVAFTPDLYAAAVDYVGVANLFTFMKTIPPYWEPFRQQMYQMVGNPDDPKDRERLQATSPVFHADRIKAPLFVAQGARDPRVNKAESDQMVEALKKRGVEVQYMVKDNEGHGFSNEETQLEFYGAMEKFLKQHLKP